MPRPRIEHKITDGKPSKYCHHCDDWKPLNNYYSSNKTWDRLNTICIKCSSLYHKNRQKEKMLTKRKIARDKILVWLKENYTAILKYARERDTFEHDFNIEKSRYIYEKRIRKNNQRQEKYQNDINFHMKEILRSRVIKAIKSGFKNRF